jgi:hypothetical protein
MSSLSFAIDIIPRIIFLEEKHLATPLYALSSNELLYIVHCRHTHVTAYAYPFWTYHKVKQILLY